MPLQTLPGTIMLGVGIGVLWFCLPLWNEHFYGKPKLFFDNTNTWRDVMRTRDVHQDVKFQRITAGSLPYRRKEIEAELDQLLFEVYANPDEPPEGKPYVNNVKKLKN